MHLAAYPELRLGVLTLPAGFMAGIAVMTSALEIGIDGIPTVLIGAALALAGLVWFVVSRRPADLCASPERRGALGIGLCSLPPTRSRWPHSSARDAPESSGTC